MNAKSIFSFVLCAAAAAFALRAHAGQDDDPANPEALVSWEPSSSWSVGLAYTHRMRPVEVDGNGPEWTLSGESCDAFVACALKRSKFTRSCAACLSMNQTVFSASSQTM